MASTRRKSAAIALAVVGIAGLSLAAAAQLNVDTGTLQAGTTVVATCQPDTDAITVAFDSEFVDGTAAITDAGYEVSDLTVSGVDELCDTKAMSVTLIDAAGESLAEVTGTAGTGATSTLSALPTGISAEDVEGVAVVISG